MWQALHIAINNPDQYKTMIEASHISLAAFGGMFLLMVFLHFFLDENKDIHWVHSIEKKLKKVGRIESAEVIVALIGLW